ncbi:MAG: DNA internalization-related competence protein ComEC/Rec2 [Mycoplasmatales bacterium]
MQLQLIFKQHRKPIFVGLLLLNLLFLRVVLSVQNLELKSEQSDRLAFQIHKESKLVIRVIRNIKVSEFNQSFEANIKGKMVKVTVSKLKPIAYGDIIHGVVEKQTKIENKRKNLGSFDYEKYLLSREITTEIQIRVIKIISQPNLIERLANIRLNLIDLNEKKYLKSANYINALVYGNNELSKNENQLYAQVGIIHLFSISGTHISFLIIFFRVIFSRLNISLPTIDKILLVCLPLYLIFVGFAIGAIRVILTEICVICLPNVSRLKILLTILYGLLLINPFYILNFGFQLSFLISIILYGFINFKIKLSTFEVSVLIWISTIIFTTNSTSTMNILTAVANYLIVPVVTIVMTPLAILFTLINVSLITNLFDSFFYFMIVCLTKASELFNGLTINVGQINYVKGLVLCYLLFKIGKKLLEHRAYSSKITSYVLLSVIIILFPSNLRSVISFVDIGQGDLTIIQSVFPKYTIVIDTGSQKEQTELASVLKAKAIREIDALIITHMHEDHNGNTEFIIRNYKVKKVYRPPTKQEIWTTFRSEELSCGQSLKVATLKFDVLSPCQTAENPNNESLVLQFDFGKKRILLTGDIEAEIEKTLVSNYQNQLESDVLKVGHHGSKTSSTEEFIKKVNPKIAVISVGKTNRYGHPAPEVVRRLEERKIGIWKTSERGELVVYF